MDLKLNIKKKIIIITLSGVNKTFRGHFRYSMLIENNTMLQWKEMNQDFTDFRTLKQLNIKLNVIFNQINQLMN